MVGFITYGIQSSIFGVCMDYILVNLSMFVLGLQVFMCLRALSVFLELPKDTRKTKLPFLIVIFVILIMHTTSRILGNYYFGNALLYNKRLVGFKSTTSELIISTLTIQLPFAVSILGEGVLLYRCYVIYHDRKWVLIFPGITYLLSIAIAFIYYFSSITSINNGPTRIFVLARNAMPLSIVATNVTTTCLIIFRLLRMRHNILKVCSIPPPHIKLYTAVTVMLIESAVPMTVMGIAASICLPSRKTYVVFSSNLVFGLWHILAAICPQFIIYRVITGKTWSSHQDTSFGAMSSPLVFDINGATDAERDKPHPARRIIEAWPTASSAAPSHLTMSSSSRVSCVSLPSLPDLNLIGSNGGHSSPLHRSSEV